MTTRGPPEGLVDDDARGTDLACLKEETHRLQEADTWQLVSGTTYQREYTAHVHGRTLVTYKIT